MDDLIKVESEIKELQRKKRLLKKRDKEREEYEKRKREKQFDDMLDKSGNEIILNFAQDPFEEIRNNLKYQYVNNQEIHVSDFISDLEKDIDNFKSAILILKKLKKVIKNA